MFTHKLDILDTFFLFFIDLTLASFRQLLHVFQHPCFDRAACHYYFKVCVCPSSFKLNFLLHVWKNWSKYKMNQIMKLCHSQKYCHYLFFLALHTRKNLTKLVPLEKKISNFIVPPPPKAWKIQISWTTTFQQFFRFFYCRRVVVQCIPTR